MYVYMYKSLAFGLIFLLHISVKPGRVLETKVYNVKSRSQMDRNGMEEAGQAGDQKTVAVAGPAAEGWSWGAHCKLSNISGLHCSGRVLHSGHP